MNQNVVFSLIFDNTNEIQIVSYFTFYFLRYSSKSIIRFNYTDFIVLIQKILLRNVQWEV